MRASPPAFSTDFTGPALARRLAPLVAGILAVIAVLAGLGFSPLSTHLPKPAPADLDSAVLAAKAQLARSGPAADLVLVGDSSCMMNVDTLELGRHLGVSTLNLGTFSHLDLAAHARLLKTYLANHPVPSKGIVLLLHPSALRRSQSEAGASDTLRRLLDPPDVPVHLARVSRPDRLAAEVLRDQLIQPWLPSPLRGDFASAYGTTWQIHRALIRNLGSLPDPTRPTSDQLRGRIEIHLSAELRELSRAFRDALPGNTRLWVGFSPTPDSMVVAGFAAQSQESLSRWTAWLSPATALSELPATWPASEFATYTHLNTNGIRAFTLRLAEALALF